MEQGQVIVEKTAKFAAINSRCSIDASRQVAVSRFFPFVVLSDR
jgi:hypothetical protein